MSQSSGKWQGNARIQGGCSNLRHAIFMPALVAIRFDADLKAKYDQLAAAGKEKKVAVTAVMRKRLVLANAQLCDHRMLPCRAVGSTVLWATAHKRLRPSCRWTKGQLSTRTTQVGLLNPPAWILTLATTGTVPWGQYL
ncbi:transposase [Parasedimentitalea psychrophila]|uniref:Transposase n=1 Tax=Parasedimentitalea psychrophila TaxID=2997337 RepID=A0A9Y2L101_9RHOB|nr:transposase [Parasedimentitalea psychrophila]WIY25557.1 transposase [Parasedimentitalea psychrophila]